MTCGGTKPTSGCKCAPNRLARAGKWADRSGQLTCPGACKCATFCPTPELILRAKSGQLTCPGACKCATFCPTLELVLRARSGQLTCPGACKCATPQWSRIDWMKVDQSHAPEHVSWSTCPGPHASSRDPKWPAVGRHSFSTKRTGIVTQAATGTWSKIPGRNRHWRMAFSAASSNTGLERSRITS